MKLDDLLKEMSDKKNTKYWNNGTPKPITVENLTDIVRLISEDIKEITDVMAAKDIKDIKSELSAQGKAQADQVNRIKFILDDQQNQAKIENELNSIKSKLDALKQSVEKRVKSAVKTDTENSKRIEEQWNLLKQVIDVAAVTTAGAFFGPAGALIVGGALKLNPWMLASGVFSTSVIGPTELKGADGKSYWSNDVTPAGMSIGENLLFRVHSGSQQLFSILNSRGNESQAIIGGGISDLEKLPDNIKKGVMVKNIDRAFDNFGDFLVLPYITAINCVPDIYTDNYKYFYVAEALDSEIQNLFTNLKDNKANFDSLKNIFEKTKNDILYRILDKHEFTKLEDMHQSYPPKYTPLTISQIKLHKAGFVKHIEHGSLFTSKTATGRTIRAKKTDLVYNVDPGANQLKSLYRDFDKWPNFNQLSEDHKNMLKDPFQKAADDGQFISKFGKKMPFVNHRITDSDRVSKRKRLIMSWFIVHKMFELHTGFALPALIPWNDNSDDIKEAFLRAVFDILELTWRLGRLDSYSDSLQLDHEFYARMASAKFVNSYLYLALIITPTVIPKCIEMKEHFYKIYPEIYNKPPKHLKHIFESFLELLAPSPFNFTNKDKSEGMPPMPLSAFNVPTGKTGIS